MYRYVNNYRFLCAYLSKSVFILTLPVTLAARIMVIYLLESDLVMKATQIEIFLQCARVNCAHVFLFITNAGKY